MSLSELDEVITEGLKEYVADPQVSVIVKKFGGRKFVVLGEVRMPGVYRFVENVSVLEAIALAGGFVKYAEQNNVVLVRGDINKSPKVQVIKVNACSILYQGAVCGNLMVQQGDIIYVTQSLIGRLNDFLTDTLRPALEDMVDFFVVRSAWRWQGGQHRN
ncbi:MAG: SLBB domain-containing protein [Candidatus Omnitrophica bacterium]|nr:SLBB domain-containing protein [Candidatus Omnitrophota bacterium]